MKIVNWNVFDRNRKILKGLEYIKTLEPDIITLQEFPEKHIEQLFEMFPESTIVKTFDFESVSNIGENTFLVNIIKNDLSPKTVTKKYSDFKPSSLLHSLLYKNINKHVQRFNYLKTEIESEDNKISILNFHLPTSVNGRTRQRLIQVIFNELSGTEKVLVCADLNVSPNLYFDLFTGWAREYKYRDYKYNERNEVEKLFHGFNFENVFFGENTTTIPKIFGTFQFDHILSKGINVQKKEILQNFGSDHKVLVLEV